MKYGWLCIDAIRTHVAFHKSVKGVTYIYVSKESYVTAGGGHLCLTDGAFQLRNYSLYLLSPGMPFRIYCSTRYNARPTQCISVRRATIEVARFEKEG